MKKVTFIGAPGCGKSTITNDVYVALKKKNINVEMVPEMIRYSIQRYGPLETIWEQYKTRNDQCALEDAIPKHVDYLVSDSGTLTMFFYAALYADKTDTRQRLVLADMYKYLLDDLYLKRYDYVFFLPRVDKIKANEKILNDGTRFQSNEEVDILDEHMSLIFTKIHKLDNVHCLDCDLEKRTDEVLKIIL